jgi:Rrf2 family protein
MRITLNAPARLPILSQTAEHALRAVLYLAGAVDRGHVSAAEVANALGAPPNYLAKTLRLLARRGLLGSVRGAHGGFLLRVPADRLTAAEVVEAVDEVTVPAACLLGDRRCDPARPCDAHARWSELRERILRPLAETTIADLLAGSPDAPVPFATNASTPSR